MIRMANKAILVPALAALAATCALAQTAPEGVAQDGERATAPGSPPRAAPEAPPANRITGIETNRDMIAAEAPTDIVINGTFVARCGLVVDYGDGTRSGNVVSESSPFPLRLTHTFAKTTDVVVRVTGADEGSAPPCEGAVEAAVHVSPAGSKIEYITLTTGCPEGWLLKGTVSPDRSFRCAPIPDASAPTNLIHCIDGMKYFAMDGHVGCRHPHMAAVAPEPMALAKTPMPKGKAAAKSGETMAKAKTPALPKAQSQVLAELRAKLKVAAPIVSVEAPH